MALINCLGNKIVSVSIYFPYFIHSFLSICLVIEISAGWLVWQLCCIISAGHVPWIPVDSIPDKQRY